LQKLGWSKTHWKDKLNLPLMKMPLISPRRQIRMARVSSTERRNTTFSLQAEAAASWIEVRLSSTTIEPRQSSSAIS